MNITGLKVRYYGDPCLRRVSDPVDQVGPAERILIDAMFKTMYEYKGIGLAAPQVGINKRIFVLDTGEKGEILAVVNPRILKSSGKDVMEEGCLSIPGVEIKVKRPAVVEVEFSDAHNVVRQYELSGLIAKAFQHELDHLNGKLIVDYANVGEKMRYHSKLKELEKGRTRPQAPAKPDHNL